MSIYTIRYTSSPSSKIFRNLLRNNFASSREESTYLKSLPSDNSRNILLSNSDIPLTQRLASLIVDIPLQFPPEFSANHLDDESSDNSNSGTDNKNKNTGIRTSLAIAGGGSKAISALASTPGASSTLINASLLYDRKTFLSFISSHPLPPAPMFPYPPFGSFPKDIDGDGSNTDGNDSGNIHQCMAKFNFVSEKAASLLSNSALHQSLVSSNSLSQMSQVVGVGCTSTLVSIPKTRVDKNKQKSTVEDRNSRAHLCLSFPDGLIRSYSLTLGTGGNADIASSNIGKRRTRSEEEEVLANFILWTLVQEQERRYSIAGDENMSGSKSGCNNKGNDAFDLGILNKEQGDVLSMKEWSCNIIHPARRGSSCDNSDTIQDMESILHEKANEVINSADTSNVLLVPGITMECSSKNGKIDGITKTQMSPMVHTVLPPNLIIFPGSFNPPHMGHVALARAAIKTMSEKYELELDEWFKNDEGKSYGDLSEDRKELLNTIWNTIEQQAMVKRRHQEQQPNIPVSILFEMSLTNADKPPVEASEAARRVGLFAKYKDSTENFLLFDETEDDCKADEEENCTHNTNTITMPSDWGVLLTSAPLFSDKVRILKKSLAQGSSDSDRLRITTNGKRKFLMDRGRLITFVIGTDTLVRILNPKYYNQDQQQMLEALREMGREGVHFVVGGRVEQVQVEEGEKQTRFVNGEDKLIDLPLDVKEMFTIIPEKDFRLDISSTELRNRMNM